MQRNIKSSEYSNGTKGKINTSNTHMKNTSSQSRKRTNETIKIYFKN